MAYKALYDNVESGSVTKFKLLLNNAGDSAQNPIISGFAMQIRLAKHDSSETFRNAWIVASDGRRRNLNSLAVETDEQVTFSVVNGTHTFADDPPIRNRINITTTNGHFWSDFYVASQPTVKVTLNGYSGEVQAQPLIWPFY